LAGAGRPEPAAASARRRRWRITIARVALPLSPPLAPQLARSASKLPEGEGWSYEPKWDGFRAIAFVDGDAHRLQSRGGKGLERYFPELVFPPGRYVLDGELVILDAQGRQDFEALQQRIHPAVSRIKRLALETPARFVAFDALAREDTSLLELPLRERRETLEALVERPLDLTPATRRPADAEPWLQDGEGVIAKELDAPYRPGERAGMVKVKRVRTMDCVVVGWRPGKEPETVGSLILGLYDAAGQLRVVGHTAGFTAKAKRELVTHLLPFETGERGSGDASRWTAGRELEWVTLRPELVVEVAFDHVSGGRIRHGARLKRWREDRDPLSCTLEQLDA
jgi:ATP-dependent DNA ligase